MKVRSFFRFFSIVCLIVLVFAYAMFQGGFVSWFLFYSVASVFAFSALVSFLPLKVKKLERIIHESTVRSGDRITVTIRLEKMRFQPFFFVRLIDQIPSTIGKGKASALFFFSFQSQLTFSYSIDRTNRGVHTFQAVTIVVSDLFGWMERQYSIPCETTIYVYPNIHPLTDVPVRQKARKLEGKRLHSFDQSGRSIAGIRNYIPGDRLTTIDWKQSARSSQLKTKEFESFHGEEFVIAFDPYEREGSSLYFEKVVDFVASVIVYFNQKKSQIQLAVRLEEWVQMSITDRTVMDGMKLLAQVEPVTSPLKKIDPIYLEWKEKQVFFICSHLHEDIVDTCDILRGQHVDVTLYLLSHPAVIHDEMIAAKLQKKGIDIFFISLDEGGENGV